MSLGKYGMLIKKNMKVNYPIRYQELIINGTIMDKLLEKEEEVNTQKDIIEKQMKERYIKPQTQEFIVIAKYNQMIQSVVEEQLQAIIQEEI